MVKLEILPVTIYCGIWVVRAGFLNEDQKAKSKMKLPKINLNIDEQNVLIKSKKTAIIIIKTIILCCFLVIGWQIYLLMKD